MTFPHAGQAPSPPSTVLRLRARVPPIAPGATQVVLDPLALSMLLEGVDLRAVRRAAMWQPGARRSA